MNVADEWQDKKTVGQLLNETSARLGEREAWCFKGERVTFRQLRERADCLAGAFLRLGVRKDDKISLWMPNRLEWVYAYLAAAKIGAALVPVNTRFKAHEAEYVIGQSDSTTLIFADKFQNIDYASMVAEICPELAHSQPGRLSAARLPQLRNVVCLGSTRYDGMYTFEEVTALGNGFPADDLKRAEAAVNPDDVFNILYTSGTTGFPKGAMHSHKSIRNMTEAVERFAMNEQDCIVFFLPLFHVYGTFITILSSIISGARVVLMDLFDAGESLRLMEKERATILYGMDVNFYDQLRHPNFAHTDLRSLRTGLSPSGSPNLVPLLQEVVSRMVKVRGTFGMTETSSIVTLTSENDPLERLYNTSGYPLPGFQLKIVDPQTGKPLPANTVGELCIKGHAVTLGYYKKPEETAKAIEPEGWFHSGDLAQIDEQGYMRFMGRLKEIFRVGGENADPVEVEALLLQHPAVGMVRVTGVPDKRLGEVGMAFVQFKAGMGATEQELISFCKGKIASFKVPRYVMEIEEYPMTPSGKVQKFKLREIAVEKLGLEG